MRAVSMLLIGVIASFSSAEPALANALTASTILQDFNVVIFNNATTQADIEGAAVIGGNFSGATVFNNPNDSQNTSQPSGFGALTVFGNTNGNSINIDNGGNAYVAGSQGANISFNGGGYIAAPSATISSFSLPLIALSQSLSLLAATGTLPPAGNNEQITAVPGPDGIAVFNLTAAQLAAIPSFTINLGGASTVVFNVEGSSASFSANDESGTAGANNIIWNFYDATGTVAFNTQIGGTVLAVGATVTNNNQIDGDLVAENWTGQGEAHSWPFNGNLPSPPTPPPTPTPEPASLVLFGSAIGLMGLLGVRRHGQMGGRRLLAA